MNSKLTFIGLSLVIIFSIVIMFAVSIEKKEQPAQTAEALQAEDSLVIAEQPEIEVIPEEQVIPIEPEPQETLQVSFANVSALTFWNDRIAAGTEGGVFTYRPSDSAYQFFYYGNGLTDYQVNDVMAINGKLYVGTEGALYEIDKSGNVKTVDFGFQPPVISLGEDNGTILIGTLQDGLIAYYEGSAQQILQLPEITSIVSGGDLLWVSTAGHGLYSFDGMDWKKRFLINDTTALDFVTDLGYKFDRLYAATMFGLYVFDGGRWDLYNEEDNLLICNITNVAFKGWKIVVGTLDWGIYELFEDVVTPKAWSEGLEVTALASNRDMTVLGTPGDGIYISDSAGVSHINPSPQTFTRPLMALSQ